MQIPYFSSILITNLPPSLIKFYELFGQISKRQRIFDDSDYFYLILIHILKFSSVHPT